MRKVMMEKIVALQKDNGLLQESKVVDTVLKEELTFKEAKAYVKKLCGSFDEKECNCINFCKFALALLDCCDEDEKIPMEVKQQLSDLLVCFKVKVEEVVPEQVVQERKANNKYFSAWTEKLAKYN